MAKYFNILTALLKMAWITYNYKEYIIPSCREAEHEQYNFINQ